MEEISLLFGLTVVRATIKAAGVGSGASRLLELTVIAAVIGRAGFTHRATSEQLSVIIA